MRRRGFLAMLAGAALDPERLLWVPGRKLISIPTPREYGHPEFYCDYIVGVQLTWSHDPQTGKTEVISSRPVPISEYRASIASGLWSPPVKFSPGIRRPARMR
jgi:hypothetical protein